jgi:hypothetical protein
MQLFSDEKYGTILINLVGTHETRNRYFVWGAIGRDAQVVGEGSRRSRSSSLAGGDPK